MFKLSPTLLKESNIFTIIGLGLLTALCFSAFIYFEHFGMTNKVLNTLLGVSAIALLLYIPRKSIPIAGFTIGLLWFYWIGYSFEYQGVGYMTPIITVAFGFVYLLFFLPLYFTDKAYIRAIMLFGLSYFTPFDWNWLTIEILFVDSYIGVYKYQLFILLVALSLPQLIRQKNYTYLPLILLIGTLNFGYAKQADAPLKIKLVQTDIKQEVKWTRAAQIPTREMVFSKIKEAQKEGYELIVFPESVLPLYLNKRQDIIRMLSYLSQNITIVVGSLFKDDNHSYNVSYRFENGTYKTAKKVVLVPFGEYIPLPKFARKFINDTFFKGASDFESAKEPTDFMIKGIKFRNAICYEATREELYQGDVKYIIATSNNAWFAPSIEPTIQKLLMRYFARKNGVTIYHAANYAGTGVIK